MLSTKRIKTVEGLSQGSTATIRLPIGMTYHSLLLKGAGDLDVVTGIDEIRLVINGKPIQRWKNGGAEANTTNLFDGRANATSDNTLVLDFERKGMLKREARAVTAIGTGLPFDASVNPFPITTMYLELDLASDAGANLQLVCKARQSPKSVTGMVTHRRQFSYAAEGAGDFEITDLPKGGLINRVFFKGTNIDALTIERDGYIIFERDKGENERIQADGIRVPQAGYYVFDPTEEGYGGEGLATRDAQNQRVQDLRFRLEMSGAENIQVTVEYIDVLGQ